MTTSTEPANLDKLCIDTIRTLSMDGVRRANSAIRCPDGASPVASQLSRATIRRDPANPDWSTATARAVVPARLHAALLLLHLAGFGVSLAHLKNSASSAAPPPAIPSCEADGAPGVEVTTGPLGRGDRQRGRPGAGRADLAARFVRDGHDDRRPPHLHDRQRQRHAGASPPRPALAGHLGLGSLIACSTTTASSWPAHVDGASAENVGLRYEAYGWHVQDLGDDIKLGRLEAAIAAAGGPGQAVADHPAHAHRLRVPEQAGHPEGTRVAARGGRGAPDQGGLRLGSRRALPRARRGAGGVRRGGRARRPRAGGVGEPPAGLPVGSSRAGRLA